MYKNLNDRILPPRLKTLILSFAFFFLGRSLFCQWSKITTDIWGLIHVPHMNKTASINFWNQWVLRLICQLSQHAGWSKTKAATQDKCDPLWGLHRVANFLKTPLPFCTSWCYRNPGPRVDLLWLMASSSASTRVHHIICWEGQTLHPVRWGRGRCSNVGNRKRKWTRPGRGERMEGTEYNICPTTLFINL